MLASLAFFATGTAEGIECGGTVGPGETVTLQADLGPCGSAAPAITVDSGTLDMGGFTVSVCDGRSGSVPVIRLVGTGATLSNGRVRGCTSPAIEIAGTGGHVVHGALVEPDPADRFVGAPPISIVSNDNQVSAITLTRPTLGFDIGGKRNRVQGNTVQRSFGHGFIVRGSDNEIVGNVVRETEPQNCANDTIAFSITGKGHRITDNQAIDNGAVRCDDPGLATGFALGVLAFGPTTSNVVLKGNLAWGTRGMGFIVSSRDGRSRIRGITFEGNHARGNQLDGFFFVLNKPLGPMSDNVAEENERDGFHGSVASFSRNTAVRNGGVGFALNGVRAKITENVARDNVGAGFEIAGARSRVVGNVAAANLGDGLRMLGGKKQVVEGNTVTANGANGIAVGAARLGGRAVVARRNRISANVATGHLSPAVDLLDGDSRCRSGSWRDNEFGSAEPASCIH